MRGWYSGDWYADGAQDYFATVQYNWRTPLWKVTEHCSGVILSSVTSAPDCPGSGSEMRHRVGRMPLHDRPQSSSPRRRSTGNTDGGSRGDVQKASLRTVDEKMRLGARHPLQARANGSCPARHRRTAHNPAFEYFSYDSPYEVVAFSTEPQFVRQLPSVGVR